MALSKASLAKFIKQTNLRIIDIVDESTPDTEVYRLNLAEPITAIGSNVTDKGAEMRLNNVTSLMVAGEDYVAFTEQAEEVGDEIHYTGKMKVDVSRPKGRQNRDGSFTITRAPQAWLTAVAFNKKGGDLQRAAKVSLSDAVAQLFGKVDENGKFTPPAPKKEKLEAEVENIGG